MKTYIRLIYNSKGTKPSEVYKILKEHKCIPAVGEYDFVYDWGEGKDADLEQLLTKLDNIHNALAPHDVNYLVCTSDPLYHIKELDQSLSSVVQAQKQAQTHVQTTQKPSSDSNLPPPPEDWTKEQQCTECGGKATYVKRYDRWYCTNCKKYV